MVKTVSHAIYQNSRKLIQVSLPSSAVRRVVGSQMGGLMMTATAVQERAARSSTAGSVTEFILTIIGRQSVAPTNRADSNGTNFVEGSESWVLRQPLLGHPVIHVGRFLMQANIRIETRYLSR